jgi:D-cysteine desulfhydrase family pyridoxal phosphate-dependent enzyme
MTGVAERLAGLRRVPLLSGPTPLEHWSRLSRRLRINLFAKRDDLSGIGAGGNKLRKLELLMGKAQEQEATWLLTTGGPQSNHARMTAAVAAKLGLGCTLMLKGQTDRPSSGNLLFARLFGAQVRFVDVADYPALYHAMAEEAARLSEQGQIPMQIPLGGATPEGTAAYVSAFAEMQAQLMERRTRPDVVVVAAGTASTYAGLRLGAQIFSPATRVFGVSVSWTRERLKSEAAGLLNETCSLLELPLQSFDDLWFDDTFVGPGYAQISEDGLAAVHQAALSEGVVLDTTYTGKALAGLIALVDRGEIARNSNVVFLHTGGMPELFARSPEELLGSSRDP